jgi:hypothetical protein
MGIFWIIFSVIAVYILLVYVASRFVVPFMGWRGFERPVAVPEGISMKIAELESHAVDQQSYLTLVYDFVLEKTLNQWEHTRFRAATHIPRAFVKDLKEIWETKKFVYCTGINYLIFVMLTGSKFFSAKGGSASGGKAVNEFIRVRHVFVNFFIHQYIQVKIGDKWVDVDPAGTGIRGKPLGTHLAGFG